MKKQVLRRPKSTPYSYLQRQPISTMSEEKSSQNLISQLRIKSVRQSKVRIVKDPSAKNHFDVLVNQHAEKADNQNGGQGKLLPSQYTTSQVHGKDKVISNATNLHRETGSSFLNNNTTNLMSSMGSNTKFNVTNTQILTPMSNE